jgi:alkanesulfonate monooxygenase SsuD/methylene tetrahydromethanopterin reductase-like flavin-dependent oxidoreductase (luciferase family)
MVEVAGAAADGFICHPLLSSSYLANVLHPGLAAGRATGGTDQRFTTAAMAMVATGRTEEAFTAAVAGTKRQIGFYASTPAYKPVLDHHGWGDLHAAAHAMTKQGRWGELGDLIDDEVLTTFAVVGELDQVGDAMRQRFDGLADRVILSIPYAADDMLGLDIVSG